MKKMRPILLAVLLVTAFFYATTHRHLPFDMPFSGEDRHAAGKVEIIEAAAPQNFDAEEQNNISIYKKVLPSVVSITTRSVAWDFFYGAVPAEGQGSGFIIDKEGHILTNYHVVAEARQVEVALANRKRYRAEVIGADPSHDLAVIQIKAPLIQPAVLGDSKSLVVGQKVYAIGNPFGLTGTMTRGIVSSIRSIRGLDGTPIDDAIQTDAAINPGNSGGPLLNSRGEVIGINAQITAVANQSAGIGFAIPINTAKAVLNDLVAYGRVKRPQLGVRGLPLSQEISEELDLPVDSGVLIMQVVRNSPAARAGLRGGSERAQLGMTPILLGGDIIVSIDGQEINDLRDLGGAMNNRRVGDTVKVTIYRGKKKMDVTVVLSEDAGAA
ncbi:MAG: trypsin-like peptidase domain-containing protein [Acidobacteriales bacterium]|nr:trypsin-like peptidase domain-containing protein [Terriglobales bacterium]